MRLGRPFGLVIMPLAFDRLLQDDRKHFRNTKEKIPVVVVSSVSTYEHQIIALVVPMQLQLFQSIEKRVKNDESLSYAIKKALTELK